MIRLKFLEKKVKVRISIGNIDFFAYSIFKNIEISWGQGVVQIKANSVLSITNVIKVLNEKNCWHCLPRKKLVFHTEICEFRD